MYSVHCDVYNVECAVFTVYSVRFKLYTLSVKCTQCTECVVCSVEDGANCKAISLGPMRDQLEDWRPAIGRRLADLITLLASFTVFTLGQHFLQGLSLLAKSLAT